MTAQSEVVDAVLLGHPSEFSHFVSLAGDLGGPQATKRLHRHERTFSAFIEWMPTYVTAHRPTIRLRGAQVNARLVICPFLPQLINSPHKLMKAYGKVKEGCSLAAEMGARVVALGGFTSILMGTRRADLAENVMTLTSGNSLTAALAVSQLRAALGQMGRCVADERVAIVGASGDIGRTCAHLLDGLPRRLILVAKDESRLKTVRDQLRGADVTIAPLHEAADEACAMIIATSATQPLLTEADLRPGCIVCDVGYPNSVSGRSTRDDVTVFAGGLAQLPHQLDLGSYTRLPRADLLFGCFTEGIVLAARPDLRHLATLQGMAEEDRASRLLAAAEELGIIAAPVLCPQTEASPTAHHMSR